MFYVWCGRRDLNSHALWALPPEDSVSAVPPRPHISLTETSKIIPWSKPIVKFRIGPIFTSYLLAYRRLCRKFPADFSYEADGMRTYLFLLLLRFSGLLPLREPRGSEFPAAKAEC
jgi:hypothetical protein